MVAFSECEPPASESDVDALETRLGFAVPAGVRRLLTSSNGGRPAPNVFRGATGSLDVSECLALREGRGSIEWTYDLIVVQTHAAPRQYLPFAVDSGGNLFLVDCSMPEGAVYVLLHDPQFSLRPLGVGIEAFWSHLEPA